MAATLVNARFVKPLDTGNAPEAVQKDHNLFVTMEENVKGRRFRRSMCWST